MPEVNVARKGGFALWGDKGNRANEWCSALVLSLEE